MYIIIQLKTLIAGLRVCTIYVHSLQHYSVQEFHMAISTRHISTTIGTEYQYCSVHHVKLQFYVVSLSDFHLSTRSTENVFQNPSVKGIHLFLQIIKNFLE